jgi:lipopolysaccharide assembly outer membrane protein LptD (OstA)
MRTIRSVVFFALLLISAYNPLAAQVTRPDTLKNVRADTVDADGGEELAEKVNYSAEDSVVAMPGQNRVILYGKARVEYEGMNMEAEHLDIDYATSIVKAYGGTDSAGKKFGTPSFKDGEQTMEADTIKYNLKSKKGKIYNALTRQGELLVTGSEIKKDSNDITYFTYALPALPGRRRAHRLYCDESQGDTKR